MHSNSVFSYYLFAIKIKELYEIIISKNILVSHNVNMLKNVNAIVDNDYNITVMTYEIFLTITN